MDEEMRSLWENGTWELVEKPEGVKPVPMKWAYRMRLGTWSGTSLGWWRRGTCRGRELTSRRSTPL